jgi:hypothetical protein
MPFDPKKTPIATLLWLARQSAEDGGDTWWREPSYGLTPRVLALMDRAYREATGDAEKSTRMTFTSYGS